VGGIPILPAHVLRPGIRTLDAQGNPRFLSMWGTDTPVHEIVGNGPYVMERYTPSQRVVFRRNPYYWRKDEQGRPLPRIEQVINLQFPRVYGPIAQRGLSRLGALIKGV